MENNLNYQTYSIYVCLKNKENMFMISNGPAVFVTFLLLLVNQKVIDYDQEMTQSQTVDQPTAPWLSDAEHIKPLHNWKKATVFLSKIIAKLESTPRAIL